MKALKFTASGTPDAPLVQPMGKHKTVAEDPYAVTFRSGRAGEFQQFMQSVLAARAQRP